MALAGDGERHNMGFVDWLFGAKKERTAGGRLTPLAILDLSGAAKLPSAGSDGGSERSRMLEQIKEDLRWLFPPADVHDSQAWDRYSNDQIAHGLNPQLFDMFCDDRRLIDPMMNRRFSSVLCAGNGISQEPRALASAGFKVTAMDLSPAATRLAQAIRPRPDHMKMFLGRASRRSGGTLEYLTADLLDVGVCPGPFDVIIERRTVQLFRGQELGAALQALARRLRHDGLFCSHCHDGGWRPPARPVHAAESWFQEHGWTIWRGGRGSAPPGRVAWLSMSTG